MNPFQYERASDAVGAVARLTQAPKGVFLGGGTNLVDLMKLGVAQPDLLVDITHLPYDRIEPPSPTPSITPPASVSVTCRSLWTSSCGEAPGAYAGSRSACAGPAVFGEPWRR